MLLNSKSLDKGIAACQQLPQMLFIVLAAVRSHSFCFLSASSAAGFCFDFCCASFSACSTGLRRFCCETADCDMAQQKAAAAKARRTSFSALCGAIFIAASMPVLKPSA